MKIIKIIRRDEEPSSCVSCEDEWNGFNIVRVNIFKNFSVWLDLCDKCLEKLQKEVSNK